MFKTVADRILQHCAKEKFTLFVELTKENLVPTQLSPTWGGVLFTRMTLCEKCSSRRKSINRLLITPPSCQVATSDQMPKLATPWEGWYKANWDASLYKHNERLGIGVVVKDSTGRVIAAKGLTRFGTVDQTAGEALASNYAASLCRTVDM